MCSTAMGGTIAYLEKMCHPPRKRGTQTTVKLTRGADAPRLGGPVAPLRLAPGHDTIFSDERIPDHVGGRLSPQGGGKFERQSVTRHRLNELRVYGFRWSSK